MFNFYKQYNQYQPRFWRNNSSELEFSPINYSNPYLIYLQEKYNIQYLLQDFITNLRLIANNQPIIFNTPPNTHIFSDDDKKSFLLYLGNMWGLPIFNLEPIDGFILDSPSQGVLDEDIFGSNGLPAQISAQQYASCLLARFYKIYGSNSLDNIINSVQLVSQTPFSQIEVIITNQIITFNFGELANQEAKKFIDYLDINGYNLWIKPQYGLVIFNYS